MRERKEFGYDPNYTTQGMPENLYITNTFYNKDSTYYCLSIRMKLTLSNCITLLALMSVPAVLAQTAEELTNQELQTGASQNVNEMGTGAIAQNVNEMGTDVNQNVNEMEAEINGNVNAMGTDAAQNVNELVANANQNVNAMGTDTVQNVNEMETEASQNANELGTDTTQNMNEIETDVTENINVVDTADIKSYFPAVAVASFTGPTIVGEFSFYQDSTGKVVATGALQRGLVPDAQYHFRFHNGPSCEALGEVVSHHSFKSMRVMEIGATAPIQETIEDVHLTGQNGLVGSPWVLSDGTQDVACVVLKGQ
jgi:hypothetical protein